MRCLKVFMAVILVALVSPIITYAQDAWIPKSSSIKNVDGRALFMESGELYLATRSALYKGKDVKDAWESIFYIPAGENEITCLDGSNRELFVGTRRGLFRSQDRGSHWGNVFRTIVPEKSSILCLNISKDKVKKIMIGTERGVFLSEDSGNRWKDISANLKNKSIQCIARHKASIYLGSDSGLYSKKEGSDAWDRVMVKSVPEKAERTDDAEPVEADEEGQGETQAVKCITSSGDNLYVAAGKNIAYSDDGAKTWKDFSRQGLSGDIACLVVSMHTASCYCATTKGVFEFSKDKSKWCELYTGMDKRMSVRKVIVDEEDGKRLWAVTDRGLYALEGGRYVSGELIDVERGLRTFTIISADEPTYVELQKAAIRFADVSPEKIAAWHRQSRIKAILPKVSFGMDNDRSTNYEIYTSATKDYVTAGPDDISKGWDVSISWELGDLIWSTNQTSIDVRSRLMVQLRNDILDDLRRLYYERKRIQFELITQPPKDIKARFEKEMRLEELTHAIDDLTGNYLSDHLKKVNRA